MNKENAKKLSLALGLDKKIVGVKFLFLKEEYDDLDIKEFTNKMSFCAMTLKAMNGITGKADKNCFACQGGPETFGITDVSNYVSSGKQYSTFKLYESHAVARQAQEDIVFIKQRIHGIVVGPLEDMEDADVVLFIGDCRQIMRVIQGYAYHYGMPKNIGMIGNQGICADLVARPFQLNDLNVSLLCYGARLHSKVSDGELGAGMPIHIFNNVVKGVISTINSAQGDKQKRELLERLDEPNELGVEIEFGKMYGSYSKDLKYPESLYKQR